MAFSPAFLPASKQSNRVGRRGNEARVVQGRRSQQEAVSARLLGVLAQRLEIPQLADRHAKLVEEPWMQDWFSVLARLAHLRRDVAADSLKSEIPPGVPSGFSAGIASNP